MDTRPRVSVISIARLEEEFQPLRRQLSRQTWRDFEFVGEVGGTIPEAWNRAIARAQGEILVFTETDAQPVNERWLEELVASVPDERTIVKGLEVTGLPWDLSNLACHRAVFSGVEFDERLRWAEDTELFCRLQASGFRFLQVPTAPVIHLQKMGKKRLIRRAFRYGLYHAYLRMRYGRSFEIAGVEYALKRLLAAALNLLGSVLGYLLYWPQAIQRLREKKRGP